ncbi:beta strand repeat-containing protein, partial [Pseudomonadota bacterium]
MNFCQSQGNTGGYNLTYDGSAGTGVCYGTAGTGDVSGSDPSLEALALNGHAITKTIALKAGSPAQVVGNNASCETTDQRGTSRPQHTTCDIGAYESTIAPPSDVCSSGCTYTTIQAAINASSNGDSIMVKDGTYSENINFNTKVITVISENGAATTIIEGDGSDAPVVTFASSALTSSTVLDGFTISNANDGGTGTASRGIKITSSSAPTLKNLILKGNKPSLTTYGGAIYISGGTATIQDSTIGDSADINQADRGAGIYAAYISGALSISNVTFDSNETDYRGGAVYIDNADNYVATISDSVFTGNKSNEGGAIGNSNSDQTTLITNTNFTNNLAANDRTTYSSSTTGDGGAIFVYASTVSVSGGTFTGNKAFDYGGVYNIESGGNIIINGGSYSSNEATSNNGGALYASNGNSVSISNATFNLNTAPAGYGGAFYIAQNPGGTTIDNTNITNNSSLKSGGGFYIYQITGSTTVTITNGTQITGNSVSGTDSFSYGGGMYLSGYTTFSMTGGSISGNSAYYGGGMSINGSSIDADLDGVTVNSNTTTGLAGGGIGQLSGTLNIDDSYIQGNTSVRNGAGISIGGTTTITNSVITGNRQTNSSYNGGGIYNGNTLYLYSSTIAGNYSAARGGGLYAASAKTETVRNTVIYGNTGASGNNEVYGTIETPSDNILDGTDPLFVDLQNADSAATTAGDFRLCYANGNPSGCTSGPSTGIDTGGTTNAPAYDILGEARPVNVGGLDDGTNDYDMGAYEFAVTTNATDALTATATLVNSTSILVTMPWIEDDNNNNTYTVEYKLSSEPTIWTSWVTAASHTTSPYQTIITGLTTDSAYDIRVTFNDTDSVNGTNPQTISSITPYVPHYYVDSTGTGTVTTNCETSGNSTCTLLGALSLLSTNEEVVHVEATGDYAVSLSIANKTFTLQSDVGSSAVLRSSSSSLPVIDISGSGSNSDLIIDGFTIHHGTSSSTKARGFYISDGAAPTLKNLTILGNDIGTIEKGAGIYIDGATATIQDSTIGDQTDLNEAGYGAGIGATTLSNTLNISNTTFKYNDSYYYGGAIYIDGGSYGVDITNGTFNNNNGSIGGAIYLKNSGTSSITSTSIYSNEATGSSGAGIYASPSSAATLTIDKSYIQGNRSKGSGAGLYFGSNVTSTLTNVLVSGNHQHTSSFTNGGGIYNTGTINLYSSTIAGNHSNYNAGGFYAGGNTTVRNSIIYGNTSVNSSPNVG